MVNKYPEYDIINLDLLTYAGNLETLKPVEDKPNYHFVRGDIADRKFVFDLFEKEKPDVVVNFAAESHVDRSVVDPESFVRTNVMGTTTLLDACREYGIKRYHQVSTDEVYGDLPLDRPDLFFTEETPLHTSSPYSASKASADLFVLAYHRTYKLPVTISRCSNNYGPYHFPEKLIPLMISRALADESLPVYGTGENALAFRAGFLCPDRMGNFRAEHLDFASVGVPEKGGNLFCKVRSVVHHRQQDAVYLKFRVDLPLDLSHRLKQLLQTFGRQILRLDGNNDPIGGGQCVDRKHSQGWLAVDQNMGILSLYRVQILPQDGFAAHSVY